MRIRRQGPALVVDAPAKLNLFLEVLGRRADGFHDLETVMVSIGLYDTLRLIPLASPGIEFRLDLATSAPLPTATVPGDGSNLVVRAAQRLQAEAGVTTGVRIELVKRIPWQAGLGGGSSDAAATLVGLNALWQLGLPKLRLHELAATLGSDVNFFIDSAPLAVCRGRGECVEPLPLERRLDFVIAQPEGGLSTADVFRRWNATGTVRDLTAWRGLMSRGSRSGVVPAPYNALEPPARELHAGVGRLCRRLDLLGIPGSMTGSGSACFGVCRNSRHAMRLAAQLRNLEGSRVWAVSSGV